MAGQSAATLQPQALLTQAVPFGLPPQVRPQPLQLVASLVVLISQPSSCLPLLQSANPAAQVPLQIPPPQVRVAM